MFYLGAVGLAIFLDLLLLSKRNKTRADWLLALWLLIIATHLLMFTLLRMKNYSWFLGIDMPLPLLHGPCLYLYTRALTGHAVRSKHFLLHFAAPLAFYIYLIPFITLPTSEKIFVYENSGIGYETFLFVRGICIPASGLVYVLWSMLTLRKHRKAIVEQFSSVEKINLAWLQYLIIWLAVIWILVIISNDYWVFGATVVFIFFIGFFGIRQGVIFSSGTMMTIETHESKEQRVIVDALAFPEKSKYQKSGLSPELAAALHEQLTTVMTSEKLYKNSELTLHGLAAALNALPNHVSQIINERENKNFYDYINGLRVQEFLKAINQAESQRLTIFAVAQGCGFNSKSSFNRYFKKFTGQSPSEYSDSASRAQK